MSIKQKIKETINNCRVLGGNTLTDGEYLLKIKSVDEFIGKAGENGRAKNLTIRISFEVLTLDGSKTLGNCSKMYALISSNNVSKGILSWFTFYKKLVGRLARIETISVLDGLFIKAKLKADKANGYIVIDKLIDDENLVAQNFALFEQRQIKETALLSSMVDFVNDKINHCQSIGEKQFAFNYKLYEAKK